MYEKDVNRRDALREELRLLASAFPEDTGVRGALADCLFAALDDSRGKADLGRCNAFLQELRLLARAFPITVSVQSSLARGLFNTLNAENDAKQRDALLLELWSLVFTLPEGDVAREQLAKSVSVAFDVARVNDPDRRDKLLDQLRLLAGVFPKDAAVRRQLIHWPVQHAI
jgi:hypothetical protein